MAGFSGACTVADIGILLSTCRRWASWQIGITLVGTITPFLPQCPPRTTVLKGINEMDPPLCGSAVISHTEVSETDHEIPARRTSPMQHELRTVAIDLAKKVWLLLDSRGVDVLRFSNLILATL